MLYVPGNTHKNKLVINKKTSTARYPISDPKNVLKKGFAIIHHQHRIVTDAHSLKKGSQVSIEMRDGSKNAKII